MYKPDPVLLLFRLSAVCPSISPVYPVLWPVPDQSDAAVPVQWYNHRSVHCASAHRHGYEAAGRIHGPAHVGIDQLEEDAGPLPLDVDECVDVGAVAVFAVGLVVERAADGVVGGCVPPCGVEGVGAYLHLHHVFDYVELEVPSEVERRRGKGQDVGLG